MLITILMTARALYVPEIYIGQTERQIIIRYKEKLNTEVLCSFRMRTATSSWALTLESADSVHTGCLEIRKAEDRDFLYYRTFLSYRKTDGDQNTICKGWAPVSVIRRSNSAERFPRNLVWMSQHNRWHKLWYECHSITDTCNTKFILCFLLSVIQTWT